MKYLLLLILISCASKPVIEKRNYTNQVSPGQVTYIEVPTNVTNLGKLTCGKKEIKYFSNNDSIAFYYAEGYWSDKKKRECNFSKTDKLTITLNVVPYKYPSERLNVDKKKIIYSKKALKRIAKERKIKKKIYSKPIKTPVFKGPFMEPLNSYKTSKYGTKRIFNNLKHGTHLGTDYRARTPIDIPVSNDGIVAGTGDFFFSGNAVMVDHGAGIYTWYGHLSKILVKKGQKLKKGDIVGKSGATGRVSGPHLHWGVRVQGENVSGVSLVKESTEAFK